MCIRDSPGAGQPIRVLSEIAQSALNCRRPSAGAREDDPCIHPLVPAAVAAESSPADRAEANLRAALLLLGALKRAGLGHAVLCPGSRSAPLALAAGLLQHRRLRLHTALDERSAAFFALGLARATGVPAAVITTSGSAVAQLLPACVEADHGAIPLLLLSADRPDRLLSLIHI